MTATILEARDQILTLFQTAWDTTGLPVHYWDAPGDVPGGTDGGWAAVTTQMLLGNQNGFGLSTRRYVREGIVTVQIFTPFGQGMTLNDNLTKTVMDGFEGKATSGGVWFRQVRAINDGHDAEWYVTRVVAEFTFDEVK